MTKDDAKAPEDAPPSYQAATNTGTSTASTRPRQSSLLEVPDGHNGIPREARKSMEDELRSLPKGWIRQFDAKENHQFFVDTTADPPRSIWTHPYDDEQYLSTLSSEERERIQAEEAAMRRPVTPALSIDEKHRHDEQTPTSATSHHEQYPHDLPQRPGQNPADRKKSFGERLKNKVTGTTKEERERDRARRAEEERRYYEAHMKFRQALRQAQLTGQPQPLGKDEQGKDVYLLPPQSGYGGYGGFSRGYGGQYIQPSPVYNNPNARFISPPQPYARPGYGYGYGSPYGYGGGGLALPVLGGLAGGALLGGLLF
jgi:hypothetical protein